MKFTAVLSLAALASASAFVVPAPATSARTTTTALSAAGKTPEVGPNEYVPAGLTRAQWAEIKAADAAKKANKKPPKSKVESLDEWQKEFESGKTGHRFAKMKFDSWYKSK